MPNKKRVLVVDDEPEIVELIRLALTARGYAVLSASNGAQALQKCAEEKPDLMILDILMPGMSGYEVCWNLKKKGETRNMPIIFLTAKTEIMDRFWGEEVGGVEYITKPFEMRDLMEKVEAHLKAPQE